MALVTKTELIGLDDGQLIPITADTSSSFTCGTGIDIPGLKTMKITATIDSKDLTGDNKLLKVWTKVIGAEFEITYAKQDLAILALALGADLVAAGSSPNQKQTLSIMDDNQAKPFQLQGLILGTDIESSVKSCRFAIMKCYINATDLLAAAERDVNTFTLKGKGVYTNKTFTRNAKTLPLLTDIILSETAETIAAITT